MGIKGTTTRQIAERAGVDEVTLFRRFGSKETLAKRAVGFAQSQIRIDLESAGSKKTGELETDLTNMALLLMEVLDRHREAVGDCHVRSETGGPYCSCDCWDD